MMKGYFSRIAYQSGINISARESIHTENESRSLKPLDCHKTLMIRSASVEPKRPGAPDTRSGYVPGNRVIENVEKKQVRKNVKKYSELEQHGNAEISGEVISPSVTQSDQVISGTVFSGRYQNIHSRNNPEKIRPASTSRQNSSLNSSKQPLIRESADKTSPRQRSTNSTVLAGEEREKTEKHFFVRTAEIVGGHSVEPVEAQTVVLSEIKEWVAAGNPVEFISEGKENTLESGVKKSDVINRKEFVQMALPDSESRVVRNDERSQPVSTEIDTPRIDEQNFDLSIGTISVVIEEEERQPQPVMAAREISRPDRIEKGREQSRRLCRNYL